MENNTETTPQNQPELSGGPIRPPKRALTGCAYILPLALLLGLLGQELRTRMEPPVTDNTEAPTPQPVQVAPTSAPQQMTTPKPTVAGKAAAKAAKLTIYVPGPDAMLHQEVRERAGTDTTMPDVAADPGGYQEWYKKQANHALTILLKESTTIFPPNTSVPTVDIDNDVVSVNFKPGFESANVWQSEKITQLALYSIVNTLNSQSLNPTGQTKKVQFKVADKPIEVLGEMDLSEPLEPNMQLVAKS